MTNHFTTPEFANLLKRFGIEIDTIFLHYDNRVWASHLNHYDTYTLIATDTGSMVISSNIEVKPVYLLSQVLGWLPFVIQYKNRKYRLEVLNIGTGWKYYYHSYQKPPVGECGIEQLITQGLTEGWLTKEIIEQQIKQNQ